MNHEKEMNARLIAYYTAKAAHEDAATTSYKTEATLATTINLWFEMDERQKAEIANAVAKKAMQDS